MTGQVIVTDENGVRTVRMNRPEKKNALTAPMYDAMAAAFEGADADPAIRCVTIAGVPGAFTAGNDLEDFLRMATGGGGLGGPVMRFLHALARLQKPLVGAVQGVAVGIGTTALLHCDYVVAGTDARFSAPFARLGLIPEAGSTLLGPRLMGDRRAFALFVLGRALDAEEAKAAGLVNAVVTPDAVDAEAAKAAQEIAALPPEAVAVSRRMMRGAPEEIVARIDAEAAEYRVRLQSAEARAAFEAFLTRKK
jgi:enoyl-CoA hydratase/carnithine racemase